MPGRAGGERAGGPTTPEGYVIEYWHDTPLPRPEPYIAPGRAITGMFAYLETNGTTTHTYTEPDTPFGPLEVVATGRYYVDWGDGTQPGPTRPKVSRGRTGRSNTSTSTSAPMTWS